MSTYIKNIIFYENLIFNNTNKWPRTVKNKKLKVE